jgi:hypothetical protein
MPLVLFATVSVLRLHVSAADILKSIVEAMQFAAKSEINACMA